ncbi:putative bifunctional diguanylate cyclase/phosphodiesterase [Bacillus sp. REN16]|uniref:putative bifunctional diguanylate cyclase/phosphodiesterase n=1 Tax=Bacillus sp. REN16 TaxID=2887296 RepID=UPI001E46B7CD|nr:EAL domain-containing protein [Bacillus sp. REN16]MCC3357939.1 EAL domain-containing protein [Bacillus sp. REN16]
MIGLTQIKGKLNSDIILLVALMGLVLLASHFKLSLLYGITFTFASIFLFLILRIFGYTAAIVTGLITIFFALIFSNSPFYSIIGLVEIIFVGAFFLRGRKAKMFFVDVFFWFSIGIGLLFFAGRESLSGTTLYFLISKDITNGLFNVLVADVLLAYFPFYKLVKNNRLNKNNVSIHQFLSQITIFTILVPFFISVMINAVNTFELIKKDLGSVGETRVNRIENEFLQLEKDNGTIDVKQIEDIIWRNKTKESEIIIFDNKNNVIASTALVDFDPNRFEIREISPRLFEALPVTEDDVQPITRWMDAFYFYTRDTDSFRIMLQFPIAGDQQQLFNTSLDQLKFLLILAISAISFVVVISRLLTNNLKQLTTITTGLPNKLRRMENIEWPQSTISELRVLGKNLKKMADKLKELFQESIEMNHILKEQTVKLKESEDKLHKLAFYDSLTYLPNRYFFQKYVRDLIRNCLKKEIAIIFIDLNQFKQINDTLGHEAGDMLLKATGNKLKTLQADNRQVFRLGGDEFVVVHSVENREEVHQTLDMIVKEFSSYFTISGQDHYITASIGVSMYPENGEDLDELVKYADIAMYISKEMGGNTVQFFDESMKNKFQQRLTIENSLRIAVDKEGFEQFYQPKIFAGKITGIEALLRWNDPVLGTVSPGVFIEVAEEIGLISQIDEWSLVQACRQNKQWQLNNLLHVPISVNLSAKHFQQEFLVSMVKNALENSGLEPKYLKLEITESVFISDQQRVAERIQKLKELGVQISIDDFGKGYSSLYQLLKLPIDEIKIDRKFIHNIDKNDKKALLVKAIFDIAHGLQLNVVAEGVETWDECGMLVDMGCDEIQGYLFSRPISKEDMVEFIHHKNSNMIEAAVEEDRL